MESVRPTPCAEMRSLHHNCFRCDKKFHNSSLLVKHMREEHLSFVERGVPRSGPEAQPIVVNRDQPKVEENDSYKNHIAKCPYCSMDCQTRKKLMRHLELEHKDESEKDQEEEPQFKVIKLDTENRDLLNRFSTSSGSSSVNSHLSISSQVGNQLLPTETNLSTSQSISQSKPLKNSESNSQTKQATKHQYKCFWCEASFRKRGKLMDHIDSLHKQNKQQNQAEAEMLSNEDTKHRVNANSIRHPSPLYPSSHSSINRKEGSCANNSVCSFKHASFVSKPKTTTENNESMETSVCKFYLRKKDNPLLQRKLSHHLDLSSDLHPTGSHQDAFMGFPPQMVSPMTAAALQHSYMFGIRPPMMLPNNFYQGPQMSMMVPNIPNDYPMSRRSVVMNHHGQSQSYAQLMARLNALSQMNSRNPFSQSVNSPLDLSKSL